MNTLIIVDYKTIPKTLQYLSNCYQFITDVKELHSIIVDNSEDYRNGLKTLEKVTQMQAKLMVAESVKERVFKTTFQGKELLYVCAEGNIGYAKGNNLGARVSQYYYGNTNYLFSNNDLHFTQKITLGNWEQLFQQNKDIAVIGPQIIDLRGKQQSPRKKTSAWNQLFMNYYDMLLPQIAKTSDSITDMDYNAVSQRCYWVSGSFMYIDGKKFRKVKGFDEGTFLFYEEAILAERLKKIDCVMYFDNEISIIHEHGQTVSQVFQILRGIQFSFDSCIFYFCKYCNLSKVVCVLAKINFIIFSLLFQIKKKLGKIFKK